MCMRCMGWKPHSRSLQYVDILSSMCCRRRFQARDRQECSKCQHFSSQGKLCVPDSRRSACRRSPFDPSMLALSRMRYIFPVAATVFACSHACLFLPPSCRL
jgi:hypothetical protein